MLCLKNRSKQLPNCLNSLVLSRQQPDLICSWVLCWHLPCARLQDGGCSPRRWMEEAPRVPSSTLPALVSSLLSLQSFSWPPPHTQAVPQKEAAPWRPYHTTFSSGSWLRISDAIGDKRVVSWCITGQDMVPACARQPSETKCLLRSPPGASERLFSKQAEILSKPQTKSTEDCLWQTRSNWFFTIFLL